MVGDFGRRCRQKLHWHEPQPLHSPGLARQNGMTAGATHHPDSCIREPVWCRQAAKLPMTGLRSLRRVGRCGTTNSQPVLETQLRRALRWSGNKRARGPLLSYKKKSQCRQPADGHGRICHTRGNQVHLRGDSSRLDSYPSPLLHGVLMGKVPVSWKQLSVYG